jgi:MFS transporter, DHA1 family, inner membrane transport protein
VTSGIHDGSTRWFLVWFLFGAGVVSAFHVGKAPIAIPLLRHDLGLSLIVASWVIGVFAGVPAIAGLPGGIGVSRLGARRSVIVGLLLMGAGSCAGALATNGPVLLLTRIIEGVGFLMLAVAVPSLLNVITATKDRDVVFVLWAVYYAAGSAVSMLIGPLLLAAYGWQSLWLVTGILSLLYGPLVWIIAPSSRISSAGGGRALSEIGRIMRAPGPVLLALAFGFYTLQYHALSGLLPTLLVERLGLSVAYAGVLSAVTVVANGVGAMCAGLLLRLGIPLWAMVMAGFGFVGLASFGLFNQSMPALGVTALAAASLGLSGTLPALIYAAAPRFAPHPVMLALTVGIVVQASNLGFFFGPAILGAWVESFGWSSAPALFVAIACAGIAVALGLRRLTAAN